MIGRLHHVVIDCPDPGMLARFYADLLGLAVVYESADWVVIATAPDTSGLAFQLAPDHVPPRWPDPAYPQQFHLDVMVDDLNEAEPKVVAWGARRLNDNDPDSPIFADPAGHPFCLIPRPGWASPISTG